MPRISLTVALAAAMVAGAAAAAPAPLVAPDLAVGRNLQVYASVRFAQPLPADAQLVLTSSDPKRLLLSAAPDKPGSGSITLALKAKMVESPEFWAQAMAQEGSATYSAAVKGLGSANGVVSFSPSAVLIVGPLRLPSFPTTPGSQPARITMTAARLDSDLKVVEEQQIAGGLRIAAAIANSNPEAGRVDAAEVLLSSESSMASALFKPASTGKTTLKPVQPPGFTAPAEFGSLIAMVEKPGLAVVDGVMLGKDLQIHGILCLGEAPPPAGLEVTLASSDPGKLLLSVREDEVGRGSIKLKVPAGEMTAHYYLQGLSSSGAVTYSASAAGFRSRMGKITLTPSGVIIGYERYGPPDEAAVLRQDPADEDRRFYASLSNAKEPVNVVAWTAHLDPASGLAADITVQQLRAGVSVPVLLHSSNPAVATVQSPLTIKPGENRAISKFTPVSAGETKISVTTPPGFSTPKNAILVPATVTN